MKEKRSFTKKVGWFFSILLLIILIPYFIISIILTYEKVTNLNSLPSVFVYTPFIVKDNSMKGNTSKGDLLILKSEETYALLPRGEIVAFKEDNNKYKIREIDSIVSQPVPDENGNVAEDAVAKYKTIGTNRKKIDRLALLSDAIFGVYFFNIPKVGQYISYIENTWMLVISLPILALVIVGLMFLASKCEAKKIPKATEEDKLELMSAAELTSGKNIREELNKSIPLQQQAPQQITVAPQEVQQNITPQVQQTQVVQQKQNATGQLAGGINIVPPSEVSNTPTPQVVAPPQTQQAMPQQQPYQQPYPVQNQAQNIQPQQVVPPQNNQSQNQ